MHYPKSSCWEGSLSEDRDGGEDLADTFRRVDARTSRLSGLEASLRVARMYGYSDGAMRAIEKLIEKERRAPRPIGIPVAEVRKPRASRAIASAKLAA